MKRSATAAYAWEKNEQQQLQNEDTGTPDTGKREWRENQVRESLATILLLPGFLSYQSMGLGQPEIVVKTNLIDKMVQPCGPAPPAPVDDMIKRAKEALAQ
ncbi:hypothetical protein TVAG_235200 [Trichomonas vaginalis G3]|uniref:Uncharacterized protein n=1 Tax=Trichomonas vaginalis (strain ATCC PRA-98 / G3) TaxID=412133 RepID=A2DPN8_TRIV3|nr:mRNA splicing, via spliceosome [Trichomonas vaginalis G3]EAY17638.1 hypothetical protein TVAG_235200 [Trichomonas vaginalis G3]KAI5486118.1 mRNA splicing, via spliceosome [Trichomonas vaginalis G3]|eukprot:XP_001329773.1 hypothetical protein [Trichomonas vaginalis G3]